MIHPTSEVVRKQEELAALDQSELLERIDSFLLIFFPLAFFVFNIIYWPYWTIFASS